MSDGRRFIYYLGHWLPPALAASCCPDACAPWLLALWTFLGLELALLAAASRWGVRQTAWWAPVSYTHLDVYKRQILLRVAVFPQLPAVVKQASGQQEVAVQLLSLIHI